MPNILKKVTASIATPKPPVAVKKPETEKKKVAIVVGEIEEGLPIAATTRESIYEFGLDEMNENQSRFIAPPEGVDTHTLKMAIRNHLDKERRMRDYRQNFVMRDAEKDGVQGIRVYCVSIKDKPMRANNKQQARAA